MKRAHEKFSSISKLGFSVLVACLIAVPALMGTVFVNAFNGNLVAFAADLEASPQSLSEAKAALDAAKQNQEAASAQHDEAKNATIRRLLTTMQPFRSTLSHKGIG